MESKHKLTFATELLSKIFKNSLLIIQMITLRGMLVEPVVTWRTGYVAQTLAKLIVSKNIYPLDMDIVLVEVATKFSKSLQQVQCEHIFIETETKGSGFKQSSKIVKRVIQI